MSDGRFQWLRRMGVHEAYHQSGPNRVIHWICIPIELFAFIRLLALPHWGVAAGVAALVGVVYLMTDVLAGALMAALLGGLVAAARQVSVGARWLDALVAVAVFVLSFTVQTQLGHRVFERGVDDTDKNITELRKTGNPIPIVLVFYYHLVEVLFALGYRPGLRAQVDAHTREELARLNVRR